ncbi:MAG: alpha/beta hydrolase [Bacteroidia bacterium]
MNVQSMHRITQFDSAYLGRAMTIDVFLPTDYASLQKPISLLLMNDGQQGIRLKLAETVSDFNAKNNDKPLCVVAIHSGPDRVNEYGVAATADYAGRGAMAGAYSFFILKELLPWIEKQYPVGGSAELRGIGGFSLGGLSAFDLAWHYPDVFSKAGIFSGSFWWRSHPVDSAYRDAEDRIMHRLVKTGTFHEHLRMWFFAGTAEESEDRNNNGIIDVIDDIQDLMSEIRKIGYKDTTHLHYEEMEGGMHTEETWAKALPACLEWLY